MRKYLLAISGVTATICAVFILLPSGAQGREKRPVLQAYFSPKGGVMKTVIREIRGSEKTLDVALYMLTASRLAREIVGAHKRGVKVRVILDKRMIGKWSEATTLEEGGVPTWHLFLSKDHDAPADPKFHHKFAVIDGKTVITGSYNWTVTADEKNHEDLLVIQDRKLASVYTGAFEKALKLVGEGK